MNFDRITPDERLILLDRTQVFSSVDRKLLMNIAQRCVELSFRPGETVISEGEDADRIFIIAEGHAEVSVGQQGGKTVLATLGPGELFGEMGLIGEDRKRHATVVALSELRLLSLDGLVLKELLPSSQQFAQLVGEIAEIRRKLNFLKRFSPFRTLSPERLKALFARLENRKVGPLTTLIRQGEKGEECYLIISGMVEVFTTDENQIVTKIATLYPGCILGEAALLTDEPRNSTVRTVGSCELLVIRIKDLLVIMREDSGVGNTLIATLQQRDRPRQEEEIVVQQQMTAEGDTIWVLKNPQTGTYVRLTDEGWFVWERLDGHHTLKDLTLEFASERKVLAPEKIAGIIAEFARTGLIKGKALSPRAVVAAPDVSWGRRLVGNVGQIMEWNLVWKNPDPFFSSLYNSLGRILFMKPVQLLLSIVAMTGLVLFFSLGQRVATFIHDSSQSRPLLIFLMLAMPVALIMHETGHALTTKHYKKEVRGAGIGWYWFSPVAFIDTTDMWTAEKWPRVLVSIAGPCTDFVLAGLASCIAWVSSSMFISAALWQFAMVAYINVLMNFNPLLEYDGYFILSDLKGRHNLRRHSLKWIGKYLKGDIDKSEGARNHKFDLVFGISSIFYVFLMAYLLVVSYRVVLESHLKTILPASVAWGLPLVLAGFIVVSAFTRIIDDMNVFRA